SLAYLPALDWYVLTAVDLQSAHIVEPRWIGLATLSVVLLIASLLAGFGYGVERIVLRPLRRLQQSARAVANGNYAVSLPPPSSDEIGDLNLAFSEMTERVRQHTDELEDRVRARTVELEAANRAI